MMTETPASNYPTKQGNSMFDKDSSVSAPLEEMTAEKLCQGVKALIDKETAAGDSKAAAKLQDAYDTLEEYKTEEANETMGNNADSEKEDETGSPEGTDQAEKGTGESTAKPVSTGLGMDMALGPMSNLKNYLARKSVETQSQI